MASGLTAMDARTLSRVGGNKYQLEQVRKTIRQLNKDILAAARYGRLDVSLGDGVPDPLVLNHFKAMGYWVLEHKGFHQGGGSCTYYRLTWAPKPPRWWEFVFGQPIQD